MMSGNDLEDLVIDESEPKNNSNNKGILAILALLIAILIIAVMMTKMVLRDSDESKTAVEIKKEETINPELKLDENAIESEKDKLDMLSNGLDEDTNQTIDEITEVNDSMKPLPNGLIPIDDSNKTINQVEAPKKEDVPTKIEDIIPKVEPVVEPKKETKRVERETKKEIKRVERVERETKKETSPRTYGSGSHYIQVGSYANRPGSQFLSSVGRNGFQYKLHVFNLNGAPMYKLLVGPYPSREVAIQNLPSVQNRINKGAFVTQLK